MRPASYFHYTVDAVQRDANVGALLHTEDSLSNTLISLRLRPRFGRLHQGADNGSPCQLDLEVVMALTSRAVQEQGRVLSEKLSIGCVAYQHAFAFRASPGLVRNATQGYARLLDATVLQVQCCGHRYESKRIGKPITDLQVAVMAAKVLRG